MGICVLLHGVCVVLLGALITSSDACNMTLYAQREPLNFTSPNYPHNYRNNDYCYWNIYPQTTGYRVVLDMVYSNIAGSSYSCLDSLTLNMKYSGDWRTDSSHKICGKARKSISAPRGQYFYVVFKTDNSITESGFLIRFYESEGGTEMKRLEATVASKTFISPGYPNAYYPTQTHEWTITTEQQNQIVFLETIDAVFQNPSSGGICYGDYVNVYNGQTRSDLLGTFCGTDKPVFISSVASMRIFFHTDNTNNYKGFQMRYRAVPATMCKVTLTAAQYSLKIVSTGKSWKCEWYIKSPASRGRVGIQLLASDMDQSPNGTCAELYIYDGRSTDESDLIGRWCGSSDGQYTSRSNSMTVLLRSGDQRPVRISYKEIQSVCGSTSLTASSFRDNYLTSPGYPDSYPNDLYCVWEIYGPSGRQIKVEVMDIALESNGFCQMDYLVFQDGTGSNADIITRICGPGSDDIYSSDNQMRITFQSDLGISLRGFRLKYSAVGSACGNMRLTAHTWRQYLTSPGYPSQYLNGLDCQWKIVADYGYSVKIDMMYIDMESSDMCTRDYLLFSDGARNTTIGKVCRSSTMDIFSTSNSMFITFHTDSSVTGRGFSLQYSSVTAASTDPSRRCGRTELTAYTTRDVYLTSPGYPSLYANNLECIWTISAPLGNIIRVEIVNIQMETSTGCASDYLLFRDGVSADGEQLEKLCNASSRYIFSSGISMTITFHTDGSTVSRGFKVKFTAGKFSTATRDCGGDKDVTYLEASIDSPKYPLNYPNEAECTWKIFSSLEGHVIHTRVSYFELELDPSCTMDYVQIYDGPDRSAVSLGRWCGRKGPTVESSGQAVCVVFRSDLSVSFTGFSLSFSAGTPLPKSKYSFDPSLVGLVGGTIAVVVVVSILVVCCVWCRRKKPPPNNQLQRNLVVTMTNNTSHDTVTNNIYSIAFSNQPSVPVDEPAVPTSPPSYDDVVKNDPPSYFEVVAQLDSQPVVTSCSGGASANQGADSPTFRSSEV
ncbi:cubilin-like [Haliotis asinina]|uniref:cubilin-like n=1 Tax=Haliotis asinina TaxID=109174 RepID=UPI003531E2AD